MAGRVWLVWCSGVGWAESEAGVCAVAVLQCGLALWCVLVLWLVWGLFWGWAEG